MASLFWLLVALLLLALCHVQAPVWFTDPATVWIVQAGIILLWLLVARFGFAVQLLAWRFPTDKQEEEAERVFGPLCERHPLSLWPWRKKRLPWLLVTGQTEHVNALLPGLTEERWQVSWRGILLWCGEPGQIADADLTWLKRRRRRCALSAMLWVTDAADTPSRDEHTQHALWRQLKRTGERLGWRLPVYAMAQRADEHEQYDRPRQSTGVCWTPGMQKNISDELKALAPSLVTDGMAQVQHNRRWSWLLQLAQDIREGTLVTLTAALQPLAGIRSGVLFAGLFMMPPAPPGQHAGYRECSLSPAWYGVLHQASIRRGRRDRLTLRDGLFRGLLLAMALWCTGMLTSAYLNTRLVRENSALLAQMIASASQPEQLHQLRELQRRTDVLLYRAREGTPLQLRFGLDQNARELHRLWSAWQQQSQRLMLSPVMAALSTQLRQYADLPPDAPERRTRATEAYDQLKAYLMLTQPEQAEPTFLNQTLVPLWYAPDSRIRPGEWLMLSTDMLGFYSRELPYHPDWRQRANAPLVAAVRTLLRSQKGLRNSENALYQSVLQQAMKRHPAVSLSDLMARRDGDSLLDTDATLPGIFTREAWEQDVRTLIARVAASRQVTTDRVLDDGKTAAMKVLSEEALRTRLTERYFADYAAAWLAFINSIQWQRGATLSDTLDQLSLLGDSQRSPLPPLLTLLRWQAGVGQEGRTAGESLLNSAKQLVTGDSDTGVTGLSRTESKPADVVVQTFAPLLALMPAEDGKTAAHHPAG
ncbi:ImcF-related family protein [Type-D symbiont of Plautia stali]|uniref:ImcF-related family protein n=1 Tax=Type-D symbiont of Plautia stali TaxID=1560356 RepID=UPI00073E6406|nr:ImcF-related family protein [Type-D symbiont of Plautia stali]